MVFFHLVYVNKALSSSVLFLPYLLQISFKNHVQIICVIYLSEQEPRPNKTTIKKPKGHSVNGCSVFYVWLHTNTYAYVNTQTIKRLYIHTIYTDI